ncbi:S1 RNA-binding domain-containing protein [Streptomyces sp. NPDC054802]
MSTDDRGIVTFVELGGVVAVLNIPEVSWDHVVSPGDVISEGQELAFTVLSVETEDDGRERVSLSLKRAPSRPR